MHPSRSLFLSLATVCCLSSVNGSVLAQESVSTEMNLTKEEIAKSGITKETLAKDNNLFIQLATKFLRWRDPQEPFHIAGPLYFVGTQGLSSFLFVTTEGNILLNTGDPTSGPMVEGSIRKLGFRPEDIKIMINGHAHSDHSGGFAHLKKLSNATLAVMEPDVAQMEDGGKSDFHYGADWQIMGFEPVKVDRILRDGDTVALGDVVLTAFNTPGHTRGSTTWVTQIVEGGKAYKVVFPDGGGFNPGYRVSTDRPSYPGISQDYRKTHHFQEMLEPEMWFGHHTEYFDMQGKLKKVASDGPAAWVDPEGFRKFVVGKKQAFEQEFDAELSASR